MDKDKIKLSREKRAELVAAIRRYFLNERNEEMGDLAAALLLDFIVKELAPAFYNQGVSDAYRFMGEKTEELLSLLA